MKWMGHDFAPFLSCTTPGQHKCTDVKSIGSGKAITLIPENDEDMWHLYNLIATDDIVRSSTIRKVTLESSTGSTQSNRIRTTVSIQVESVDYDASLCQIRLKGRNVVENDHIKMGAYHTLEIEANRKLVLTKNEWDVIAIDRIRLAIDVTRRADLAVVVMQPGLAHLCLVTESMTLVRAKIECAMPKKRNAATTVAHERASNKFFDQLSSAVLRHVNFDLVKAVLVGSAGFLRDQFLEHLFTVYTLKPNTKAIAENKSKFLAVHSSSGFKHSVKEILSEPALQSRLADTKAIQEVQSLDTFYRTLAVDCDKAVYGWNDVAEAAEMAAIQTLMISDSLFRSNDFVLRKKYVNLVESVRCANGDVHVFSSLHFSGEQLDKLTGIAAVLRFPVHMDEYNSDDDDHVGGAVVDNL